jgi:hypothetical protein
MRLMFRHTFTRLSTTHLAYWNYNPNNTLCSVPIGATVLLPPDHLLLDSAPNLGPLTSRWEINKFENCWYKSQDFRGSNAFVSAIFEFAKFPTRYEWSNIRRPVQ